jgi:Flp pilus assembly pilin Flp
VTLAKRFLRDERGATAVEYGLICACMYDMISATIGGAIGG